MMTDTTAEPQIALRETACRASGARRRRQRGLTLIELIVTLAIVAIVSTLGVPSFSTALKNSRLTTEVNRFVSHIQLARSEAVKRNRTATICRNGGQQSCGNSANASYHTGWLVYVDMSGRDDDYDPGDNDQLVQIGDAASSDITINSDQAGNRWLSFAPNGMLDENGQIARYVFCADNASTAAIPGRLVTISVSGQPRITKRAAGTACSL